MHEMVISQSESSNAKSVGACVAGKGEQLQRKGKVLAEAQGEERKEGRLERDKPGLSDPVSLSGYLILAKTAGADHGRAWNRGRLKL